MNFTTVQGHVKSVAMKYLVTGASGHLGANLVRRLLQDNLDVRVLMRDKNDVASIDGLKVEAVYGDLRDFAAVRKAMEGVDRVYHCAAKVSTTYGNEREIYDSNVVGTRHILKAAREAKTGRVVVTGSFSAVGNLPDRPSDETVPFYPFNKEMPYECSKAWVEHECWRAVLDHQQDVVVATSCAIIGPYDFRPSRMGLVIRDFAHGKLRAYIPGGFEFVAARDLVQGHLLTMEKGRTGQKYVFATEFRTLDEWMEMLEEVTGKKRPRLRLSPSLMYGIASVVSPILTRFFPNVPQRLTPGAVRILKLHRHADTSKAKNELGYQPTSIKQAVQDAYDWFVDRGEIKEPRMNSNKQYDKLTLTTSSKGAGKAA